MTDRRTDTTTDALPLGARAVHIDLDVLSTELAERLLEAGASDDAIDAAGGIGSAQRLRAALAHDPASAELSHTVHGGAAPA